AKRSEGAGEIVALGGNLLFHADYTRSLAERSFLVAYFVSAGEDPPARELSGSFRDPEHRVMTLDGPAIVLIKESWTPAWRAQLLRSGGPGARLPTPFSAGSLRGICSGGRWRGATGRTRSPSPTGCLVPSPPYRSGSPIRAAACRRPPDMRSRRST